MEFQALLNIRQLYKIKVGQLHPNLGLVSSVIQGYRKHSLDFKLSGVRKILFSGYSKSILLLPKECRVEE
jgi:hypothetical protein